MAKRKRAKIADSVRFEVFKRDQFKCQYCGRCAPEVVLVLDHIDPHSKGGADEIINLITACRDCNSGKSDRRLSDDSAIAKQRAQLEELEERRQQLEMMLKWRTGLADLGDAEVDMVGKVYARKVPGYVLNATGLEAIRKLVKKFGSDRTIKAIEDAADQVVQIGPDGNATADTAERVLRFAHVLAEPDEVQALYRIRARIRRCWNYTNDAVCIGLLRKAMKAGATAEEIDVQCSTLMRDMSNFRGWVERMEDWISDLVAGR